MEINTTEKIVIMSIGLVVISLFVPYYTADDPRFIVDNDLQDTLPADALNNIVLIIGPSILVGAIAVFSTFGKKSIVAIGLCGVWETLLSIILIINPPDTTSDLVAEGPELTVSGRPDLGPAESVGDPGIGLFLLLLAGLLLIAAAYNGYRKFSNSDRQVRQTT